jgi:hypothetical protein
MPSNAARSTRRLPDAVRRRLDVATAMAWEALVDAHTTQALDFIALLQERFSLEEALDRYLRELGILEPMATGVRTKVLVALESAEASGRIRLQFEEEAIPPEEEPGEEEGWRRFTPGALVSGVRERQRNRDEAERLVMLATARAEEAVIATHVDNAITFAALLDAAVGLDRAVQEYIQSVGLQGGRAQAVFQRTMARLADVHLPRLHAAPDGRVPRARS